LRKLIYALLLLTLLLAGAGALAVLSWYRAPLPASAGPAVVEVKPGEGLATLARRLAAEGRLDRPRLWVLLGRLEGKASRIRAGEYAVPPGTTPAGLLDLLVEGRVILHPITLVEGWTFVQALETIRANPVIRRTFVGPPDATLMARLGAPDVHFEGQLFPDTYLVPRGTTDLEVLELAHRRLQRELAAAWEKRAPNLPIETPYEALILASIIEKETGAPDERPRIAGVFVNRLQRGMRLETDPTVIYGLGGAYDGNIRRRDLRSDTPYNTYTRDGLPPTPIALASGAAIEAAVRPLETDELFFVATGSGDGRHVFSRTYAEHSAAVQRYLARLRSSGASGGTTR
jgi:UPF0755 protein